MKSTKEVNIKDQLVDIKPTFETYNWPLVYGALLFGIFITILLFKLARKMRRATKNDELEIEVNWEKLVDDVTLHSQSIEEAESQMMMLLKSFLETSSNLPFSSKSDSETIALISNSNVFQDLQKNMLITFINDSEIRRFSPDVTLGEGLIEKRKNELKNILRNITLVKGAPDELR